MGTKGLLLTPWGLDVVMDEMLGLYAQVHRNKNADPETDQLACDVITALKNLRDRLVDIA